MKAHIFDPDQYQPVLKLNVEYGCSWQGALFRFRINFRNAHAFTPISSMFGTLNEGIETGAMMN